MNRRTDWPARVLAMLALFAALGGSVYAAGKLKGTKIKPNSIPGNRLKDDAVTGQKIAEATLGVVPDAEKLGGEGKGVFQRKIEWALVGSLGAILDSSGGVTLAEYNPPGCPDSTFGCYYLRFPNSQADRAIQVTGNYADTSPTGTPQIFQTGICGSGPGAVTCLGNAASAGPDTIFVRAFDPATGMGDSAGFYVATIPK